MSVGTCALPSRNPWKGAHRMGRSLARAGVLRDEGSYVADLLRGQLTREGRHSAAALFDLGADGLEVRAYDVEVRADLAARVRGPERVARAAGGGLEDLRARRRVRVGRDRRALRRRGRGRVLAVEPDGARVPDADQDSEERTACKGKHQSREPV